MDSRQAYAKLPDDVREFFELYPLDTVREWLHIAERYKSERCDIVGHDFHGCVGLFTRGRLLDVYRECGRCNEIER